MELLQSTDIAIEDIYVPVKRRATLVESKVSELAEAIMEEGQQTPIRIRRDDTKKRYVLVEGLHRLEACRALGEATISAFIVNPRPH